MKTELEIETAPGLKEVVEPSLASDEKVSYMLEQGDKLRITVETGSLGALRGATDTAFRLVMLGNRILQR